MFALSFRNTELIKFLVHLAQIIFILKSFWSVEEILWKSLTLKNVLEYSLRAED